MMRGFIVIITALFSIIFLKRKLYAHHLISIVVIVTGVALVGVFSILESDDGDSGKSQTSFTGVMILLIAQCFVGGQFIIEEKLFEGYYIDPMYAVGCEGMFGTLYFSILLPIFQYVPCTTDGVCGNNGKIDDTAQAFRQLGQWWELLVFSLGIVVSIACFNVTGQAVTKYGSAA